LKKYPQIKELFGYEWSTKYIVLFFVFSQVKKQKTKNKNRKKKERERKKKQMMI